MGGGSLSTCSPDGAKRNPGPVPVDSRISLRSIRATTLVRHCEEQSDEAIQSSSFRGDAKHRTRNLEIPGLVLIVLSQKVAVRFDKNQLSGEIHASMEG